MTEYLVGHIVSVEKQPSGPWFRVTIDTQRLEDGPRYENLYTRDMSGWGNPRDAGPCFAFDRERREVLWCGTVEQAREHYGEHALIPLFFNPYVIDVGPDPGWPSKQRGPDPGWGVGSASKQGGCLLPVIGLIAVAVTLGMGLSA